MRLILLALFAVAMPAMAATPASKQCVRLNHVSEQRIADDHTIYYKEDARWFRNDLGAACPGLTPQRSLQSRTPSPSLCAGDSVTVFSAQSRVEYATCGLGDFTAVAGPPPRAR